MSASERPGTVYRTIVAAARRHAGQIAILHQERSITYEALLGHVDAAARRLRSGGIGHGDVFAVYGQNCPEILIAYYAASRIGAIMVPINPNMTAAEVKGAMRHCEAKLLFHDDVVAKPAGEAMPRNVLRPLASLSEPFNGPDAGEETRIRPEDDFVIVYTSGSTGAPKAIVLTHRSQTDVLTSLTEMWAITAADVTLVGLPLGYLYGLSTAAASQLMAGGKVVLMRRFHPGEILEAFVASRATVFQGVPTMFAMMLDYAEQRGAKFDLSGVRLLVSAGAPLAEELKERFARRFRNEIQNYYALSECTPVFGFYASDTAPRPAGAVGKLAPGASARIVDSQGRACIDGEPGELLVQGAAIMKRYHKAPEATRSVLIDGWLKTGDIARRDATGVYTITGRVKDIIIRGGANIAPAEVEEVLARHPAVQSAAVIGLPDAIFGEVPAAYIVCRRGTSVTAEALIAHAEQELAGFKVPRKIAFVSDLPLGQTGKVDRAALKAGWRE
jgi:long-chain acyl-CoA synthetase